MSTRTYNLRARTDAGVATQPRVRPESPVQQATPSPLRDLPPYVVGGYPLTTGRTAALYSDVVASRSPSPQKESSNMVAVPEVEPEDERIPQGSSVPVSDSRAVPAIINKIVTTPESGLFSEDNEPAQDTGDLLWTTVRRRRARSLESFEPVRKSSSESGERKGLTRDQIQTVKAAADTLTEGQKDAIRDRQKRVTHHKRDPSSSSRGEGTSRPKGKGIDPREWGNANLSQENLDVDAQEAALRSFAHKKRISKRKEIKETYRSKPSHREDRSPSTRLPDASRPVAQLAKSSYLGTTLRNVGRSSSKRPQHYHRESSPSSSEPSSSGSELSSSESSLSSEKRSRQRRDNQHGRNGRKHRSLNRGSSKPVIKPIAPKEYDGSADARAYHRFVRESEAYLRDGKVRGRRRRIFLLSYYLTNKGYDFYTQKVANDEANWTLSQFYDELFNYCFPVDYRMQLRKTLARTHQNEKSVAEYTHELNELFNMIGDISERDQVLKFWNGSRSIIQKGLWRDNLNPETSSWARVIAQAEIIEISENVAERRDRKAGSSQQGGAPSGSGEGSNRSKNRNAQTGQRHVPYERRSHTPSRTNDRTHRRDDRGSHSRGGPPRSRENSHASRGGSSARGRSQTPRSSNAGHRGTPPLSEKEKAARLAAGQCFICGEPGHFSRECPTNRTMKGSNSKPPGTVMFNIEPAVDEQDSEELVEVLDSLPLGSMAFGDPEPEQLAPSNKWMELTAPVILGPIEEWRESYPRWMEPGVWAR